MFSEKKLIEDLLKIWRYPVGKGFRESTNLLFNNDFNLTEVDESWDLAGWPIMKGFKTHEVYLKNIDTGRFVFKEFNDTLRTVQGGSSLRLKGKIKQLKSYIHYDSNCPSAIPYISSFYENIPGICISEKEYEKLDQNSEYEIYINNILSKGELGFYSKFLKGKSNKIILLSSYLCHPNMVNNELSGPIMLKYLYDYIKEKDTYYSYLFIINPETIGSIAVKRWLINQNLNNKIVGGIVLTCLAKGNTKIKYSKRGSLVDFHSEKLGFEFEKFNPMDGSDERQYNSIKYDIPISTLYSLKFGEYKEYHTNLDNLENCYIENDFKNNKNLILKLIESIESDKIYNRVNEISEPFLSPYGLYRGLNTFETRSKSDFFDQVKKILFFIDGYNSEEMIAFKSGIKINIVVEILNLLLKKGLIIDHVQK